MRAAATRGSPACGSRAQAALRRTIRARLAEGGDQGRGSRLPRTRRRTPLKMQLVRKADLGLFLLQASKEEGPANGSRGHAKAAQGRDGRHSDLGRSVSQGGHDGRRRVGRDVAAGSERVHLRASRRTSLVPFARHRRRRRRRSASRSIAPAVARRTGDALQAPGSRRPGRPSRDPSGIGSAPRSRSVVGRQRTRSRIEWPAITPRASTAATRTSAAGSSSAAISGGIARPGSLTPVDISSRVARARAEGSREIEPAGRGDRRMPALPADSARPT